MTFKTGFFVTNCWRWNVLRSLYKLVSGFKMNIRFQSLEFVNGLLGLLFKENNRSKETKVHFLCRNATLNVYLTHQIIIMYFYRITRKVTWDSCKSYSCSFHTSAWWCTTAFFKISSSFKSTPWLSTPTVVFSRYLGDIEFDGESGRCGGIAWCGCVFSDLHFTFTAL